MTAKDYEAFARFIRQGHYTEGQRQMLADFVSHVSKELTEDSPSGRRFNEARFLEACGLEREAVV